MKGKLVVPGDVVAIVEEYAAGKGTYEADGKIIASETGELVLDGKNHVASIIPFNPVAEPKKKDVVYATVTDIRSSMAVCELLSIEGKERGITGNTDATLHVSAMSPQYTESVGQAVHVGDIIRAEVIQSSPSIQLSTVNSHMGVVMAYCSRCHSILRLKDRSLYCDECERFEKRKIADDYGSAVFH
ncbi:MAG: exosome complex RNA-binding protein Csl4 [Thermoplasmata archaeon]|uniref:Exosome complex component Csl4 n=1 Tax=Candidatus Sysuiplasma superficiale TaxID=2823368 RepID=A0A8J8CDT7_9ARCH|nr:exosome complex RNA-binding protein Csl4 [Candidatus Sysuiplasma superficiale]MBX8644622.1 exosome complex RNA-binding protein Csl4 [Candidatus Sysuiplasma superficiale]